MNERLVGDRLSLVTVEVRRGDFIGLSMQCSSD
jgi:hypothetical protein